MLGDVGQPQLVRAGRSAEAVVTIPVSADGTIVVDASAQGEHSAPSIGIALPEQVESSSGEVTDSGAVVYAGGGSDVDVVVQPVEDGSVRINTVLHEQSAPHDFTYQLSLPSQLRRLHPEGLPNLVGPLRRLPHPRGGHLFLDAQRLLERGQGQDRRHA